MEGKKENSKYIKKTSKKIRYNMAPLSELKILAPGAIYFVFLVFGTIFRIQCFLFM